MISADRVREVLAYEPSTGVFRWAMARPKCSPGQIAGSLDSDGYVVIGLDGKLHRAHRLAWLWIHGTLPKCGIDHRNRNRADNRIDNLRPADKSENAQNRIEANPATSSRLLGVTYCRQTGKWKAQIMVQGTNKSLGRFPDANAAHAAYLSAKDRMHPFAPRGELQ